MSKIKHEIITEVNTQYEILVERTAKAMGLSPKDTQCFRFDDLAWTTLYCNGHIPAFAISLCVEDFTIKIKCEPPTQFHRECVEKHFQEQSNE